MIHTHRNQQVRKHRQRLTNEEGRNVKYVLRMKEAALMLHITSSAVV